MLTGIQKSHPSHFSKNRIWSWILKYIGYWSHIVIKIKTYTIPSQEILLTSAWLEACGKMTSILPLFLFDKQNLWNHEMTPHQQQLSTHQHTHRNTITHFLWLVRKATLNYWLRLKHIKFIIWRWKSICVLARQPDESTKLMFYLLWQPCMFR